MIKLSEVEKRFHMIRLKEGTVIYDKQNDSVLSTKYLCNLLNRVQSLIDNVSKRPYIFIERIKEYFQIK
jgi:hypothetical protein